MKIPDNYDMWVDHARALEAELDRHLVCECCGEPIQDDYVWEINNELLCEDCAKEKYSRCAEFFMMGD